MMIRKNVNQLTQRGKMMSRKNVSKSAYTERKDEDPQKCK